MEEAVKRRQENSHEAYFEGLKNSGDPKKVRQTLKRVDALQRQLNQLVIDRVDPRNSQMKVEQIKDEKFTALMGEYQKVKAQGAHDDDCDFVPLSAYHNKIIKERDGKVVQLRPILKGEVGIRPNGTIVVLEGGYGEGNFVQVK